MVLTDLGQSHSPTDALRYPCPGWEDSAVLHYILSGPSYPESDQSAICRDLPSQSWNCPTWLLVHLIFLVHCVPQGMSCIVNSRLSTPTLFSVSPSVAKLTLFPAKLTSFPFFDRVTKLEAFWEDCRHSLSGFCKGDDKVPWSLCGQNGQTKWERG